MNKPKLIDANELVQWLKRTGKWLKCLEDTRTERLQIGKIIYHIENMPTAYDVTSVVEQLEELETYKQTVTMEKHPFCASEIETVSKNKAIEIVKGNYSENPNSSKGGADNDT